MSGGSDAKGLAAGRAMVEWLLVALVFAAAGAWPTPDVNEAVYLTKARHRADPSWGRGDFFLESPDAHGVFFDLFGPLAAAVPLETAAWIGRVLGWVAVAVGFHHAVTPLVATAWGRIVAAAVFSLALRFTTAAGEWVIGGCEAKVFAWALVLGGLGAAERGRFGPAWCLCGAAAAWHPIVGGWAMVVVAAAWMLDRRPRATGGGGTAPAAAWLIGGVVLAAWGVVPALGLSAGVDAATRAVGNRIYVAERLGHHLLPRKFAVGLVARHVLAVVVWWLLQRTLPPTAARRRLTSMVGVALVISLAGWLMSLVEPRAPEAVYAVLRFYWFRLADVLVPLALAAASAAVLENDGLVRLVVPARPAVVRTVAVGLLCLDLAAESLHWPLPGRTPTPRADSRVAAADWADVCRWVRDHAPADACFLTPRHATSFTWRTGRREVVCWKNSPQDPRSLVEWRRRIIDCFSPDGDLAILEPSTAALGPERLRNVAARYGADHAIVPLVTDASEPLPFPQLYANAAYAVIRIDPLTADSPRGDRP